VGGYASDVSARRDAEYEGPTVTATSDAAAPDEATLETRCEQGTRLAEEGELEAAERIFAEVVGLGDTPLRARAALGLAVVRHDLGDGPGARDADRIAIAGEDPEYAPRASCHLATCQEADGNLDEARAAWQRVIGFGNPTYLPAAHVALGRLADEAGDSDAADAHWRAAARTDDPDYAPLAAHALGSRLLDEGDAPAAQRIFAEVAERMPERAAARLRTGVAISHLEQAITALGGALDADDPGVTALAIELLARTLPLRGDDDAAAGVWEHGLNHSDARVAGDVRDRLRRGFGVVDGAPDGSPDGGGPYWWERHVETATGQGSLALLAAELFTALDRMHDQVAVSYARAPRRLPGEIRAALDRAVRVPGDYPWGRDLHEDFRERFGHAAGHDPLPEGWPDGAPGTR